MKDIPIPKGWLGLGLLAGGVAFIYFAFHKPAQAAATSSKMSTQPRPPGGLGGPQVGVESPPEGYYQQNSVNDSTNVGSGYTNPAPAPEKVLPTSGAELGLATYTPDTSGAGGTDPYATNQAALGSSGIPYSTDTTYGVQ